MKKAYQNRAVQKTTESTADGAVQISLPMAEVLTSLEQGLGELIRKVGRMFIESVLESEVEQTAGVRSQRVPSRQAYHWGVEQGSCLIDGQRVPIARPRVRQCGGQELPLGTYQLFQRVSPAEETVWSNLMRGLSTRDYKLVLQQFMDAYGLEKSTISDHFVEASRKKLEELMSRSLQHLQICAILIDGTIFKGQHLVAATGIDGFGKKPRVAGCGCAACRRRRFHPALPGAQDPQCSGARPRYPAALVPVQAAAGLRPSGRQ